MNGNKKIDDFPFVITAVRLFWRSSTISIEHSVSNFGELLWFKYDKRTFVRYGQGDDIMIGLN